MHSTRTQGAQLACTRCLRRPDRKLNQCSKCRRVAYCDKDCQTRDWAGHKEICKRLQKVNAYDAQNGHTLSDPRQRLNYYVEEEKTRGEIYIGGTADTYGSFPGIVTTGIKCQVCFRTPFHDDTHKFSPCGKCQLAWWCSPQCGKVFSADAHTAKHCTDLCIQSAAQDVEADPLRRGRPILLRTKNTQTIYTAPSTLKGWTNYYQTVFPNFSTDAHSIARQFQSGHRDATDAVKLLAQNSTSMVLTLLYALEQSIPDLSTRSKLCIHIVAAAHKEERAEGMMEELLHYLPALQSLVVIYIGPQLHTADKSRNIACSGCMQRGRRRVAIMSPTTYHAFAQSSQYRANPPDVVAGFNTGMGEVDVPGWRESIPIILDMNVPAVFTSYTEYECLNDTALLLKELDASFIKTAEVNPWRGVIPLVAERFEVYRLDHYVNNYYFIVQGRRR
ncbi:hypothetical protein B0H16DRAFT_428249 [Mycena metata]|uniref:MYND-type domain-containing protein n=1 Tax=Mycena metata TaxID=1033252 RepID=A0AAD7NKY8_9AGAR|nr:hypothetical protein B0H16DRAFT_428249 [Mycena metata]